MYARCSFLVSHRSVKASLPAAIILWRMYFSWNMPSWYVMSSSLLSRALKKSYLRRGNYLRYGNRIFGARDGRPVDRKQPSTTHQLSNKKVQQYYYHKKICFCQVSNGEKISLPWVSTLAHGSETLVPMCEYDKSFLFLSRWAFISRDQKAWVFMPHKQKDGQSPSLSYR